MNKCSNCNQDLKLSEIPAFFDGLCKECWNKKQFKAYPFKKGISDKDQQIAELKEKLESTERLRQEALEEGIKCVEGDRETILNLQEELKEKDNLIKTLKELWKQDKEKISNYKTDLYGLEKSVKEIMKIHLTPEEKEIFFKGFERCEEQCASQIAELTLKNKELKQQLDEDKASWLAAMDDVRTFYFEEVSDYKKGIIHAIKSMADIYSSTICCERCGKISSSIYIKTDELMDKLYTVIKDYERAFYGR